MINVLLISLGCDKNMSDSEDMAALLQSRGYNITDVEEEADIALINTCCFINDALEESIETIFETAELKKGRLKYLVIAGCMSERYKNFLDELPEVDGFVGVGAFDEVADVFDRLFKGESRVMAFEDKNRMSFIEEPRMPSSMPFTGYLKIAEGCDKRCTYCAIPNFKGSYRSYPINYLVKKAKTMANNGTKELVLVAQETTCYGIDLYNEKSLHILIKKLSDIEEIEWIRLLYCYPEEIYDELINEIRDNPKVVHYIDMPLQHTEDEILRRMGRRIDKKGVIDIVEKLRKKIPDIAIRTTLIAGFPGETDTDHKNLLETIDILEFDRLGVFTYSQEEGTAAAAFDGQLPEETKELYKNEIMELQQEISLDKNLEFVDKVLDVIVEGYLPDEEVYTGRSYRDAPGVDGLVFIDSDRELMSGAIVKVRILEADNYDMTGVLAD